VDNLNGFSIDGRMIAVDHVKDYKRLVDNPDAVHDGAGAQPGAPRASAAAAPGRAQLPEGYAAAQPSGAGGARAGAGDEQEAPTASGRPGASSALAEMLAEVEGELAGKAAWRKRSDQDGEERDGEDPMAGMGLSDRRNSKSKRDKHGKKERSHKRDKHGKQDKHSKRELSHEHTEEASHRQYDERKTSRRRDRHQGDA
jgi:hypothetical protein